MGRGTTEEVARGTLPPTGRHPRRRDRTGACEPRGRRQHERCTHPLKSAAPDQLVATKRGPDRVARQTTGGRTGGPPTICRAPAESAEPSSAPTSLRRSGHQPQTLITTVYPDVRRARPLLFGGFQAGRGEHVGVVLRVLLVVDSLDGGGAERHVVDLVRRGLFGRGGRDGGAHAGCQGIGSGADTSVLKPARHHRHPRPPLTAYRSTGVNSRHLHS